MLRVLNLRSVECHVLLSAEDARRRRGRAGGAENGKAPNVAWSAEPLAGDIIIIQTFTMILMSPARGSADQATFGAFPFSAPPARPLRLLASSALRRTWHSTLRRFRTRSMCYWDCSI